LVTFDDVFNGVKEWLCKTVTNVKSDLVRKDQYSGSGIHQRGLGVIQ
jgi:hypothetical protein